VNRVKFVSMTALAVLTLLVAGCNAGGDIHKSDKGNESTNSGGGGAINLPNTSGDTTGLVFGNGNGAENHQIWVKCKTQENGNKSCDGYMFFLMGGTYRTWAAVNKNNANDCWGMDQIASAGYFVNNDSLKIGYSAMESNGVAGWSFEFSGTYKVSNDTLILSESGKEPIVYTKLDVVWCYERQR